MARFLTALTLSLSAAVMAGPVSAVVIGTADTASSFPFGSYLGGYYYQQVYSAASFTAPLSITDLTFYNSQYPGGTPSSGTFDLYLSTTAAAVPTFDTNTSIPYVDPSYTPVFSGSLPQVADGKLQIDLSSAFNYDPSRGNLMLTVRNLTLAGDGTLFLDADRNAGVTNMRFSSYPYDIDQGLVTGFNQASSGAVPEPASWMMMVVGFGLAGIAIRRRHRTAVSFT